MNFPLHKGLLNYKLLGPFGPVRPAGLDFQARPGRRAARPVAIYNTCSTFGKVYTLIIFFSLYVHTETPWLAISKSHWFGIFHNTNNHYARRRGHGRGRGRAGEVWIGLNFQYWCSSRFIKFAYCAPSPDFYATPPAHEYTIQEMYYRM